MEAKLNPKVLLIHPNNPGIIKNKNNIPNNNNHITEYLIFICGGEVSPYAYWRGVLSDSEIAARERVLSCRRAIARLTAK